MTSGSQPRSTESHPYAPAPRTGTMWDFHRSHFVLLGMHLAVNSIFFCQRALHTAGILASFCCEGRQRDPRGRARGWQRPGRRRGHGPVGLGLYASHTLRGGCQRATSKEGHFVAVAPVRALRAALL